MGRDSPHNPLTHTPKAVDDTVYGKSEAKTSGKIIQLRSVTQLESAENARDAAQINDKTL